MSFGINQTSIEKAALQRAKFVAQCTHRRRNHVVEEKNTKGEWEVEYTGMCSPSFNTLTAQERAAPARITKTSINDAKRYVREKLVLGTCYVHR